MELVLAFVKKDSKKLSFSLFPSIYYKMIIMKKEIEIRIRELKSYVNKQREVIIGINNEIENSEFKPSLNQQGTIDYICQQERIFIKEIERLGILKEQFE